MICAFLKGSVQFSSVTQSCPTLCDPMNRSTPGLSVHHQLPEFTQTHVSQEQRSESRRENNMREGEIMGKCHARSLMLKNRLILFHQ